MATTVMEVLLLSNDCPGEQSLFLGKRRGPTAIAHMRAAVVFVVSILYF